MRTIEEVVLDIKRILNEVERTEEFSGDTSVEIDELVNEIMAISYYPTRKDEDWIPCAERYPDLHEPIRVWVTVIYPAARHTRKAYWNGMCFEWENGRFINADMVLAWKSYRAPEPWRGEPDAKEE